MPKDELNIIDPLIFVNLENVIREGPIIKQKYQHKIKNIPEDDEIKEIIFNSAREFYPKAKLYEPTVESQGLENRLIEIYFVDFPLGADYEIKESNEYVKLCYIFIFSRGHLASYSHYAFSYSYEYAKGNFSPGQQENPDNVYCNIIACERTLIFLENLPEKMWPSKEAKENLKSDITKLMEIHKLKSQSIN